MACECCVDYVHDLGSGHPPNNFSVILIASPTDTAHPLLESMDRSPLLLSADDSALLIVDVQEKFLPVLPDTTSLLWNLQRLGEAARVMHVPCLATEQYPEKLGPTAESLQPFVSDADVPAKLSFSCAGCEAFEDQLKGAARRQVVVAGIETHVCILQTTLDLLASGFDVFLVVDAVQARHDIDHQTALRRMEISGATMITTESV